MPGRNSDFIFIDEMTTNNTLIDKDNISTTNNTLINKDTISTTNFFKLGELPETTFEITVEGTPDMSMFKKLFFSKSDRNDSFSNAIEKIYVNEKKRTVVVIFARKFRISNKNYDPANDLEWDKYKTTNKIIVKCNSEETFDVYRAVSAACMIKSYESNSAFKSHIRKTMGMYSDSLYDVMARYLTGVMFGSWNEFVKAVDKAREDSHGRKEANTK